MDQGNLMSVTAQQHTQLKEQHAHEVHREIASFNTDNEFNREINEEDIDFNIPGLPHSTVKLLHGANVQDLIQKIENHPHRHALQSDLQQHRQFNPFSKESKDMLRQVHSRSPLDSQLLHKERATPRPPLREEARGSRVLHREFDQEEMQEEVLLGCPRPVHPRREVPQEHV